MSDADASTAIKDALTRSMLASVRHRAATAGLLRLSENEVLAIMYLRRAGELTPTALGRRLSLTSGGTTALVQRLERAGLVVRERHPVDGRSRVLRLSSDGRRDADGALAPFEDAVDVAVATLSDGERATVARFLGDVAGVAEEHAERAAASVERERSVRIERPVPVVPL